MRIEQGKLKLASIQNSCSVSKIQCWTFQGVLELCPDTSSIASRVRSSIAGAINHWQLIILWWLLSRWRYFRNKTVIQECYLVISQQTKCSPSFGVRPHRLIFFLVSHLLPLQCMIYIQYVCYLYIICILYLYYICAIVHTRLMFSSPLWSLMWSALMSANWRWKNKQFYFFVW